MWRKVQVRIRLNYALISGKPTSGMENESARSVSKNYLSDVNSLQKSVKL